MINEPVKLILSDEILNKRNGWIDFCFFISICSNSLEIQTKTNRLNLIRAPKEWKSIGSHAQIHGHKSLFS